MINANALISWFYYMYNNGWGYIYGRSGQMWTEKAQKAATRPQTVKWGKRWIGHYVTDCSGAFVFAYKKEGGSIYHGSNTIYKKYCSSKGKLKNGAREDGQPIKPGTAVFLYDAEKKNMHHIGLYVGNDTCIEPKGTLYGVTVSRLDHWDYWGELKDIDYSDVEPGDPIRRMLRQGCKGNDVKELQHALNVWNQGVQAIDEDGAFGPKTKLMVELFQKSNGLNPDGIVGPQTWDALDQYLNGPDKEEDAVYPDDQNSVKIAVDFTGTMEWYEGNAEEFMHAIKSLCQDFGVTFEVEEVSHD